MFDNVHHPSFHDIHYHLMLWWCLTTHTLSCLTLDMVSTHGVLCYSICCHGMVWSNMSNHSFRCVTMPISPCLVTFVTIPYYGIVCQSIPFHVLIVELSLCHAIFSCYGCSHVIYCTLYLCNAFSSCGIRHTVIRLHGHYRLHCPSHCTDPYHVQWTGHCVMTPTVQ